MKFKAGDKVRVIKNGYDGTIDSLVLYFGGGYSWAVTFDGDSSVYHFKDEEIELIKTVLEVGDKVRVIYQGPWLGKEYFIAEIGSDWTWLTAVKGAPIDRVKDIKFSGVWQALVALVYEGPCQHDWKLYKGFRFDEECCTKCPAKRSMAA